MVDPYEFVASPKQRRKNSKKRKSRHVNTKLHMRTRSNARDKDHLITVNEKENNSNNGFTQLIQTKMMEVKKRTNKKVNIITDENHSILVTRKRQRSINELSTSIEIVNEPPSNTNDEHDNAGTICHPRCESKDHYLLPTNKRRRACLCSKRQLDELEFAPDSIPSQTQRSEKEEQQSKEEPILTSVNQSPPPLLLLPSSPVIQPLTFPLPLIQSISIIQQEEEEEENHLNVPSIIAAPLSPAMPLNSTYIARQSIALRTQLPSTLLGLSTLIPPNTTTILDDASIQTTSSIIIQKSDHHPSIELNSTRQDQQTSVTPPPTVQTSRCSISTQTSDDYYPTHHQCNDVSVCPCVQIYTRSEQLFMASMAIFFRSSITVTPPEPLLPTISNMTKKNNKRQELNHHVISLQSTPMINQIETNNETYVIHNNLAPSIELEPRPSTSVVLDTSTVINEICENNSKKSDGSSIQININSRQEFNEKSHEDNSLLSKSSTNPEKFKSLVLTMTALKDEQKIEFNRFIEYFSVRSSTIIDDTTTHLITDEDNQNSLICPLTGKVLQAVARHLKIVSYRWVTACLTEQHYVDEIPTYEIIGDTIYNKHNGISRSRLNISNNYRLLGNYAFHLKCHACQPFSDNRPLIELIHLSGGLILKTLNQYIDNIGRQIIILCSKNYLQNKPALQQACQKLNILCIEPEWLIASIVKFDIQPYESWLCTLY